MKTLDQDHKDFTILFLDKLEINGCIGTVVISKFDDVDQKVITIALKNYTKHGMINILMLEPTTYMQFDSSTTHFEKLNEITANISTYGAYEALELEKDLRSTYQIKIKSLPLKAKELSLNRSSLYAYIEFLE